MKILHVVPDLSINSGVSRFVYDLSKEQRVQGHNVHCIYFEQQEISYVLDLKDVGVATIFVPKNKWLRYDFSLVIKIIPYLGKYDVVHVHLFPLLYYVALAKRISGCHTRLIYTEHATENNRQGKFWLQSIERFMYRQYDHVVAISEAVESYLHRFVDNHLNTIVISNGIKVSDYTHACAADRKQFSIPLTAKLLVQVARFAPPKNQTAVMKALVRLPLDYHVLFVGSGKDLLLHQQLAKNLGIEDRCHFAGIRRDIASILKMADIVVLSTHFEGFGLAAVEGMAAGKPVVASDVPGLSEVVRGAGILFPDNNVEALAGIVLELGENEVYRSEITRKCIQRAADYDVSVMVDEYTKVYGKQ